MSPFEKPLELLARGAPLTYAKYPPELHLRLMEATSLAEIKVVLYVFWYTYKFKEWGELKALTLDEFQHGRKEKGKRADKGVGLARKNIIAGIKAAVKHHLLYEIVDDRDKARITKYYAIAFWHTDEPEVTIRNPQEAKNVEEEEKDESEVTKSDPGGNDSTPHPVTIRNPSSHETLPRSEIETPERDLEIKTLDRNMAATPPAYVDKKEKEEEERKDEPTPEERARATEEARQRQEELARAAKQANEDKRIAARLQGNRSETIRLQANLAATRPEASGREMMEEKIRLLEAMREALLAEQGAEVDSEVWLVAHEQELAINAEYNALRDKERRPTWQPESEG